MGLSGLSEAKIRKSAHVGIPRFKPSSMARADRRIAEGLAHPEDIQSSIWARWAAFFSCWQARAASVPRLRRVQAQRQMMRNPRRDEATLRKVQPMQRPRTGDGTLRMSRSSYVLMLGNSRSRSCVLCSPPSRTHQWRRDQKTNARPRQHRAAHTQGSRFACCANPSRSFDASSCYDGRLNRKLDSRNAYSDESVHQSGQREPAD